MKNTKTIIVGVAAVLIVALQVTVLFSRPKIVYQTEISGRVELRDGNSAQAVTEMTVPDVALERTVPALSLALRLELVGTAVGNAKDPIAFIKDLDTNKQGIYKIGNMINDARVVRIAKGIVDLDVNGIPMSIGVKDRKEVASIGESGAIVSVTGDEIVMSRMKLFKAAGSIITTAKKMKIQPYSQADQVLGMKVEGVDKGSLIEQAGIKDKDVLTAINNQKIDSYQKALQVFKKVRKSSEIKITLLREGKPKQLCYKIEN
ncbi:MAG TPA: PDZ domain-containing protein, partial [Candidatus Omnitrophota bacterium]|nr:PDZ domain-containing protein [Candidatus Omnitrophota bacterium]